MKKILLTLAASLLVFVSAAFAASSKYADISQADLKAAIAAGKVTVIDVNGTESYKAGHIIGAIDFEANSAKLASLLPADKGALIVAYCGGPQCGAYKKGAAAFRAGRRPRTWRGKRSFGCIFPQAPGVLPGAFCFQAPV